MPRQPRPTLTIAATCLVPALLSAGCALAQSTPDMPHSMPAAPAAISFSIAPGKGPVQVPFQLLGNAVYLSATMNAKGPFLFALDTGSCCSVFASELVDELGLKPEGQMMGGMGAGSASNKMGLVKGHIEFEFPGGLKLFTDDANTLSFQALWPMIGRKFYGNIGYDVLKDLVLQLDYEKKIATFYSPADFHYTGPGHLFKAALMMNYDPQIAGTFTVPGLPPIATRFTIDTGAGGTIISTPLVKAHHLLKAVHEKLPSPSHGMGEGQSEDLVGRIASLNLGPYKLQRPLVALSQDTAGSLTMPAIGVNLGGNILRRFTVIIDYPGKTLILEPNSHLAETFAADASGLILKASGDDLRTFTIQDIVPDSPATASGLQQGDILRTIDGDPANKFVLWQLQDRLKDSGDVLKLEVQRNSKTVTCELRLHSLV